MACQHSCVDIGKSCKYSVRRASCTDCGRIGECNYFIPAKYSCPCDNSSQIPCFSNPSPCHATTPCYGTTVTNNEKDTRTATPVAVSEQRKQQQPWQQQHHHHQQQQQQPCGKQTFLQWLLSFVGLGKKNDCENNTVTTIRKESTPTPPPEQKENIQSVEAHKEQAVQKTEQSEKKVPVETPQGNLSFADEAVLELKPKSPTKKRKRSRSTDSKSRNKYLGRPLEPSPPVRRRNSKSPSKAQTSAKTTKPAETPPSPEKAVSGDKTKKETKPRPPISPIYSSEKYLKGYEPCSCCPAPAPDSSSHKIQNKSKKKSPRAESKAKEDQGIKSNQGESCPPPCPCSVCSPCSPPTQTCGEPDITELMRKRCPTPSFSKDCKTRSQSCTSPRCVNECVAEYKKQKKTKQKSSAVQSGGPSPAGKGATRAPAQNPQKTQNPQNPQNPCAPPKDQFAEGQATCFKPKDECDNICLPPSSLMATLPPTKSAYGSCPITCMRPCCVPMPLIPYSDACPNKTPTCSYSVPMPKAQPACCSPKPKHTTPTPISTFCIPTTLKSYAKYKDNDAYCKFLMSRYNVAVPDYPETEPITMSSYNPAQPPTTAASPDEKTGEKSNAKGGGNKTGNYADEENGKQPTKEPVVFGDSPSRKQSFSSFRLPKRTPVECIREQGPRSPVREYSYKLGLPNQLERPILTPPPEEPKIEKEGEKSSSDAKPKGKSPKKKKAVKQEEEEEQTPPVAQETVEQNKSDNKSASDNGVATNKAPQITRSTSSRSSDDRRTSPSRQRYRMVKNVKAKPTSPVRDYTSACSLTNNRVNDGKSSFYQTFLSIPPKTKSCRRSSGIDSYREVQEYLRQRTPISNTRSSSSHDAFQRSVSGCLPKSPALGTDKKISPVKSIPMYSPRRPLSAPKSTGPVHEESRSGKATLSSPSKNIQKPESSRERKVEKSVERGYLEICTQNKEKDASLVVLVKTPKIETPKHGAQNYNDNGVEESNLNNLTELKSSPRQPRSRSTTPHKAPVLKCEDKQIDLDTGDKDSHIEAAEVKPRSPSGKMQSKTSEMDVFREEIAAILNRPLSSMLDTYPLKSDTNEQPEDESEQTQTVHEIKAVINLKARPSTPKLQPTTTEEANPSPQKTPVADIISPIKEIDDGSSNIDCVKMENKSEPAVTGTSFYQRFLSNFMGGGESSVDPKEYETPVMGDSCVDPPRFCYTNKQSLLDRSNNHFNVGASTSTCVDSGDTADENATNVSNNYNTINDKRIPPTNNRNNKKCMAPGLHLNHGKNKMINKQHDDKEKESASIKQHKGDEEESKKDDQVSSGQDIQRKSVCAEPNHVEIEARHDDTTHKKMPCPVRSISYPAILRSIAGEIKNGIYNRVYSTANNMSSSVDGEDLNDLSSSVDDPPTTTTTTTKPSRYNKTKTRMFVKEMYKRHQSTSSSVDGDECDGDDFSSSVDGPPSDITYIYTPKKNYSTSADDNVSNNKAKDEAVETKTCNNDNVDVCVDSEDCNSDKCSSSDDNVTLLDISASTVYSSKVDQNVSNNKTEEEIINAETCSKCDVSTSVNGEDSDKDDLSSSVDDVPSTNLDTAGVNPPTPAQDSSNNKMKGDITDKDLYTRRRLGSSVDGDDSESDDFSSSVDRPRLADVHSLGDYPTMDEQNRSNNKLEEQVDDDDDDVGTAGDGPVASGGVPEEEKAECVDLLDAEPGSTDKVSKEANGSAGHSETQNVISILASSTISDNRDFTDEIGQSLKSPAKTSNAGKNESSSLQNLLRSSGIPWQKVGPATAMETHVLRVMRTAFMKTANDKSEETRPAMNMFKSEKEEREGFQDPSSVLLRPTEKDGEEKSVLSRINNL